jgi:hypothetical protein
MKEQIKRVEFAKEKAREEPRTAIFHLQAAMRDLGTILEAWKGRY